jgi:hypothetical protein
MLRSMSFVWVDILMDMEPFLMERGVFGEFTERNYCGSWREAND